MHTSTAALKSKNALVSWKGNTRCWQSAYTLLKDFLPLFIAIPAAWLAYCFNLRNSSLVSLNDLWKELVKSKNLCVKYTFDPSEQAYMEAWLSLSSSIDFMRSVYRNVGENRRNIGLFPFESLHDIRKILEQTKQQLTVETTPVSRENILSGARQNIIQCWNGLRHRFLREFGAPRPRHPITQRSYRDPRRPSSEVGFDPNETDWGGIGRPLRRLTVIPKAGSGAMEEGARREMLLTALRNEYREKFNASMKPGEDPPEGWVNDRLAELRETWRVGTEKKSPGGIPPLSGGYL